MWSPMALQRETEQINEGLQIPVAKGGKDQSPGAVLLNYTVVWEGFE